MTDYKDFLRRSTKATLDEIVDSERAFKKSTGIDIADEWEWQQLGDIVKRIGKNLEKFPDELYAPVKGKDFVEFREGDNVDEKIKEALEEKNPFEDL